MTVEIIIADVVYATRTVNVVLEIAPPCYTLNEPETLPNPIAYAGGDGVIEYVWRLTLDDETCTGYSLTKSGLTVDDQYLGSFISFRSEGDENQKIMTL